MRYRDFITEAPRPDWSHYNSKELMALAIGALKQAAARSPNRLSDAQRIGERAANIVKQLERLHEDI